MRSFIYALAGIIVVQSHGMHTSKIIAQSTVQIVRQAVKAKTNQRNTREFHPAFLYAGAFVAEEAATAYAAYVAAGAAAGGIGFLGWLASNSSLGTQKELNDRERQEIARAYAQLSDSERRDLDSAMAKEEERKGKADLTDEQKSRLAYHSKNDHTMDEQTAISTPIPGEGSEKPEEGKTIVVGGQPPIDPQRPKVLNHSAYKKWEKPDCAPDDDAKEPKGLEVVYGGKKEDTQIKPKTTLVLPPASSATVLPPNPVDKGNADTLIKAAAIAAAAVAEKERERVQKVAREAEESPGRTLQAYARTNEDGEWESGYEWVWDDESNDRDMSEMVSRYHAHVSDSDSGYDYRDSFSTAEDRAACWSAVLDYNDGKISSDELGERLAPYQID